MDRDGDEPPLLEMERTPWWRGGRFQLRRRPHDPLRGQPWWVRAGAALPWRAEVTVTLAAVICAAAGALALWLWARG